MNGSLFLCRLCSRPLQKKGKGAFLLLRGSAAQVIHLLIFSTQNRTSGEAVSKDDFAWTHVLKTRRTAFHTIKSRTLLMEIFFVFRRNSVNPAKPFRFRRSCQCASDGGPFSAILQETDFRGVEFVYISFAHENVRKITTILQSSFCYQAKFYSFKSFQ